jgi:hypothetical protein
MSTITSLRLVRERKIRDLLTCDDETQRWEASGVLVKDGHFFVVFDDRTEIARICSELEPNRANELLGSADGKCGYEGITFNAANERYYLLVEARQHASGYYHAVIVEYDGDFHYLKDRPVDFPFKSDNKGFEAVAHVQRNGQDFLLALCEGNKCKCGKKGRKPGGGRIQIFEKKRKCWRHADTIALPATVEFADYSGMSVDHGHVAVVSQVNSLLWVGSFDEANWNWRDAGKLFEFPRFDDGEIQYGNIEGVSWVTPTRIVAVSDRRKKSSQPDKRLAEKDQSVHLFDLPS